MDYTVIQEQMDRLSDAMIAKGLRKPRASFELQSHCEPHVLLVYEPYKKGPYGSDKYEWFRGGTVGEIIAKASAFIEAFPSLEETKFREFMGALGAVVDLGKENGIEVETLNPLVATMKKLSKNALAAPVAA